TGLGRPASLPASQQSARRFLLLKPRIFGSLGISVAFCRCSEGLSDVPSLSFTGSRPASKAGFATF
ncbi:hypothetical protein A2U01_0105160, partial [Trifolium medium]|nr:hypothetical protein [Trifolium medium]